MSSSTSNPQNVVQAEALGAEIIGTSFLNSPCTILPLSPARADYVGSVQICTRAPRIQTTDIVMKERFASLRPGVEVGRQRPEEAEAGDRPRDLAAPNVAKVIH